MVLGLGFHTLTLRLSGFICAAGVRGGVGNKGLQALAALTGLTNLDLDSRKISDGGLPALAPLTGLRRLDLFSARVTDAGCVALRCVVLCVNRVYCSCAAVDVECSCVPVLPQHNTVSERGCVLSLQQSCCYYCLLDCVSRQNSVAMLWAPVIRILCFLR